MNDFPNRDLAVFSEASQLPADQRAIYLEQACGSDVKLRQRVEELLRAHDQAGDFLEQSPHQTAIGAKAATFIGEKPGNRIGRYKLLQQIGEGGCGVVYMAEQEEPVRRRVALKIIKPGMDTKSVIARFEAERQALALMDHPNIAKIFDAGATESGRPYFVMELIRGVKITEYCDQHALTTKQRLMLFVQVCQAIQHAHQKGIIHRDIKPSNILVTLTQEGAALPVVIDFGIAKATTSQQLTDKTLFTAFEMLIGTPAYMSPEQAALTNIDLYTRTDIYSLGVLLYELLTSSTPFDTGELLKTGLDEIRRVIREQEPARPSTRLGKMTGADLTTVAQHRKSEPPTLIRSISGDLDWIVMKALEKDRTRRYETANGLALDVQRFLADETVSARPPSKIYKLGKMARRNKLLFSGLGVIAVLLVVSLIIVSASLSRERQALREKEAEATKSRQVTQFLENMLQGVGPSVARGRDTTMLKEILDRTAEQVGTQMTNQPEVEAELRGLIGQLYFQIGNYDQAEKMQQAALAIDRQLFGPASREAAASLNELGLTFSKEGNPASAESAFHEALGIRRQLFGNANADVAESLNNLATVYRHQRRLVESEAATREALGIRKTLFGDGSLAVADSLHNLCIVLDDEGKPSDAEATAQEMLAIRRKLLGPEDPLVAAALNDLAWAKGSNGKTSEAVSLQREALAMQRKSLGDENPVVAATLSSLGQRMEHRGDLTDADAVLNAALSLQRKLSGGNSLDYLYTLDSLGMTFEQESKWPEAEAAHREALIAWRKKSDLGGTAASGELEGLVRALTAQAKLTEAERLLDEALTPTFVEQPESAGLLLLRVDLLGRRGKWMQAEADATLLLQYRPTDQYRYHTLAALLAINGNRAAYQQLCQRVLTTFANTTKDFEAERTAQDCLLLPQSGVDLQQVNKLADRAVVLGGGNELLPFFQVCKAMAEYRLGHFPEAVDWAEKSLQSSMVGAQGKAYAVLAMAFWQLGQKDKAQEMWNRGDALLPNLFTSRSDEDLGDLWLSLVFARISLDEAASLIHPGETPDGPATNP